MKQLLVWLMLVFSYPIPLFSILDSEYLLISDIMILAVAFAAITTDKNLHRKVFSSPISWAICYFLTLNMFTGSVFVFERASMWLIKATEIFIFGTCLCSLRCRFRVFEQNEKEVAICLFGLCIYCLSGTYSFLPLLGRFPSAPTGFFFGLVALWCYRSALVAKNKWLYAYAAIACGGLVFRSGSSTAEIALIGAACFTLTVTFVRLLDKFCDTSLRSVSVLSLLLGLVILVWWLDGVYSIFEVVLSQINAGSGFKRGLLIWTEVFASSSWVSLFFGGQLGSFRFYDSGILFLLNCGGLLAIVGVFLVFTKLIRLDSSLLPTIIFVVIFSTMAETMFVSFSIMPLIIMLWNLLPRGDPTKREA